ncbi:MAG TPA: ABC transporter substrate binding protein [Opitutaceae bacterium]|nr:ABC transporter substrate binding protein [Opitutaceae bacterium]
MKTAWKSLILALIAGAVLTSQAQELKGKKVYHIASYHAEFVWTNTLVKALNGVLEPTGAEVRTVYMDTYRQKSPEHLAQVSAECKAAIEQWKPDVVIVSDDAAMKGLYAPFFKDSDVPFVFCGVNWDASIYGVPSKNITGMLEVCPITDLLAEMNKLKPGKTIGYLGSDTLTSRKDAENCAKILGVNMESVFAKDFATWKQGFLDLQTKADLVVIGLNLGISDWDEAAGRQFVEENTQVITGAFYDFVENLALISYNKLAAEQGEWSGNTAVKIMQGTPAGSIPVAANQKGELVINARIAKKVGVTPSFEMLQNARVIE